MKLKILFTFSFLLLISSCEFISELWQPDDNPTQSERDPISYEDLPEFVSLDNIAGWDGVRISKNSDVIFYKNWPNGHTSHALIYMVTDEYELFPIYARFNEDGVPRFISFLDTEVYVEMNSDKNVSIMMATDQVVWVADSLECSELAIEGHTKSTYEYNSIRKVCAVGELVSNSISIGVGVVLIGASGILEISTSGLSTPISLPAIGVGLYNITTGCIGLQSNLETLFGPVAPDVNDPTKELIQNSAAELLGNLLLHDHEDFVKKHLPEEALNNIKNLDKWGAAAFWSSCVFDAIDVLWGETYINDIALIHKDIDCLTGRADNITQHSALLYGYISPKATSPFGSKINTEMGIVLWEEDNVNNKMFKSIKGSDGGEFSFAFTELAPETTYNYRTVFYDVVNGKGRMGDILSFTTDKIKPIAVEVPVTSVVEIEIISGDPVYFPNVSNRLTLNWEVNGCAVWDEEINSYIAICCSKLYYRSGCISKNKHGGESWYTIEYAEHIAGHSEEEIDELATDNEIKLSYTNFADYRYGIMNGLYKLFWVIYDFDTLTTDWLTPSEEAVYEAGSIRPSEYPLHFSTSVKLTEISREWTTMYFDPY